MSSSSTSDVVTQTLSLIPQAIPASLPPQSNYPLSIQSDIYAIGKVLGLLPSSYKYNKVIARCTAECPKDRYQSVGEILHDIDGKRPFLRYLSIIVAIVAALVVCLFFITRHQESSPVMQEAPMDSVAPSKENHGDRSRDSVHQNHGPVPMILQPKDSISQPKAVPAEEPTPQLPERDDRTRFMEDVERMMDKAYRSTIATFCDSVFPPSTPSTGKAWADASTEFHNQTVLVTDCLIKKYPSIPETTIRQETEMRFQSLVSHVFNQMRENAKR